MQAEHVYVGIWRNGRWSVHLVDSLTEELLNGVDVLRDVRTTVVPKRDDALATRQFGAESARGTDPFYALELDGHACRGLELLRAHVQRARLRNASQ